MNLFLNLKLLQIKTIKFKYYQILRTLGYNIPKYVVIQYAKSYYLRVSKNSLLGMCDALETACRYFDIYPPKAVYRNFTEFNPIFCEADNPKFTYGVYWWNARKKEPRIKAFDKLIKFYKENKEYV